AGSRRWRYVGLPAKRWLPPQWSKCRCVLTTMSMPARSKFCLLSGRSRGSEVGRRRVQLRHAGVDQHARIGMVDNVPVDRHPLALGEQVGNEDWRDGDRGEGVHLGPTAALSLAGRSKCPNTAPSKVTISVTPPSCTRRTSIASGSYAASPGLRT